MSQLDDIANLINKRFIFTESTNLGKWKTAQQIATEIGLIQFGQGEIRIMNKILMGLVPTENVKMSGGYRMYYLKGR